MLLKSDHCGIEIIKSAINEYVNYILKSDHCGIEIAKTATRERPVIY